MKRKLLKAIIWTAALVVGLPLLLYAILVLINWRDHDPSPLAIKMMEEYRANSVVTEDDNAFVDAMGFDVGSGDDPHAMGVKRIQWVSKEIEFGYGNAGADPLEEPNDFRGKRDAKIFAISKACNRDNHSRLVGVECVNVIHDTEGLKDWIRSESWLLERYQLLLRHSKWTDEAFAGLPLPTATLFDGHRLLLAKVMILAKDNRPLETQQLLASDIRFWRRVLHSTNDLVTKMGAVVALEMHFAEGNIALKQLPPDAQQEAMPAEWRQPFSDEEKSLHKVMIGDWINASNMVLKNRNDEATSADIVDNSFFGRLVEKFGNVLFQPQDTVNRMAVELVKAADAADVKYIDLQKSLLKLDAYLKCQNSDSFPFRSAYNLIGQVVVTTTIPNYPEYARRVADIEGVRRATLAAVELREASVKPEDVPSALSKSSQRNPYSDEPFSWDATEKVIVFKGLEKGERGEHHIYY